MRLRLGTALRWGSLKQKQSRRPQCKEEDDERVISERTARRTGHTDVMLSCAGHILLRLSREAWIVIALRRDSGGVYEEHISGTRASSFRGEE